MGEAYRSSRWRAAPAPLDAVRMAESVLQFFPATDAEALKLLRASFPNYPLSLRVAALDLLMRRHARATGRAIRR